FLERFPYDKPMPHEHPAFKTIIRNFPQEIMAQLQPIDWAWHLRAARRSRLKDAARRVLTRIEIEQALHEMAQERETMKMLAARAYRFEQALLNIKEQTQILQESSLRAHDLSRLRVREGLEILEARNLKAFIMLYLKEFTPSKLTFKRRL